MTDEQPSANQVSIALPYEWALKKLLGPTFDTIGNDLASLYKVGSSKIVAYAERKIPNIDDGAIANLRVARDVFWNGSFSDEAICAEYFGGILASSRSADGKDDNGVYYVDLIKSLSSRQLRLHYILYRAFNKLLLSNQEKRGLNVGQADELNILRPAFSTGELLKLETNPVNDLVALYSKGLVSQYKINNLEFSEGKILPFTEVVFTSLGVQLFAIANNEFDKWREISRYDFGDFPDVQQPQFVEWSVEELSNTVSNMA